MGLLPDELRAAAAEYLVRTIERDDWHLSTGFVGVGYLCPVLMEAGHADIAYRLLFNETYPS
jgi:alpha-L-rhamnosidase